MNIDTTELDAALDDIHESIEDLGDDVNEIRGIIILIAEKLGVQDGPSPAPRPRATEAMLATPDEKSSARAFEPAIGRDAGEQGKAVAHEPEPRSETKAAPPRSQFDPLTSRFGPRPPELHDVLYYDYVKAQTIRNIARKARHLASLQSIEERASALQMFANLLEDEAASDGAEAS